jgi:hypothetical protein
VAGHARYTALLDACVLHPIAMADVLMSLATTGLYVAKWTRAIESEWINSIEERRPDLKGRLGYRRDQMREAVPDWEVDERAWRSAAQGLALPDPGDVAFKRMRSRWKKPQATPEDFAAALDRGGMPATAQRLIEAADLI